MQRASEGPAEEGNDDEDHASFDEHNSSGCDRRSASLHPDRGQRAGVRFGRLRASADPGLRTAYVPRVRNHLDAGLLGLRGRRLHLGGRRWVEPPYVGALWTPGYWGWYGGVYDWYPGYWGLTVGYYGSINYGFGYFGTGFWGGYWHSGRFFYNGEYNHIGFHNGTVYNHRVAGFDGRPGGAAFARGTVAGLNRRAIAENRGAGINGRSFASRGAAITPRSTYNSGGVRGYSGAPAARGYSGAPAARSYSDAPAARSYSGAPAARSYSGGGSYGGGERSYSGGGRSFSGGGARASGGGGRGGGGGGHR